MAKQHHGSSINSRRRALSVAKSWRSESGKLHAGSVGKTSTITAPTRHSAVTPRRPLPRLSQRHVFLIHHLGVLLDAGPSTGLPVELVLPLIRGSLARHAVATTRSSFLWLPARRRVRRLFWPCLSTLRPLVRHGCDGCARTGGEVVVCEGMVRKLSYMLGVYR